jgi:hypothetical protein
MLSKLIPTTLVSDLMLLSWRNQNKILDLYSNYKQLFWITEVLGYIKVKSDPWISTT